MSIIADVKPSPWRDNGSSLGVTLTAGPGGAPEETASTTIGHHGIGFHCFGQKPPQSSLFVDFDIVHVVLA
jgi:hypothetical protein